MNRVVIATLLKDGKVLSENQVSFVPDKHLELVNPTYHIELIQTNHEWVLTLDSDVFAKYVEVSVEGEDIRFSDNYFFLKPTTKKTVQFQSSLTKTAILSQLRIRSLVDSY